MKPWLAAATHRLRSLKGHSSPRARTLFWATVAGLLVGVFELGQPVEDVLRTARNALHQHDASGEIVVVAIDDRSLQEIGAWPWPRSKHAELIDSLRHLGARKIVFNVEFFTPTTRREDQAFAAALARSGGTVTLAARPPSGADVDKNAGLPLPAFRRHAQIGSINVHYDYRGAVWRLAYNEGVKGRRVSGLATALAGSTKTTSGAFLVDYSTRLGSYWTISAADVIKRRQLPLLHGKDVLVGLTPPSLSDRFFFPGVGRRASVYLHALGAETLRAGRPAELGWLLPFLAVLASLWAKLRLRRLRHEVLVASGTVLLLLGVPVVLEASGVAVDVIPALFLVAAVVGRRSWLTYRARQRSRGSVNTVSGLPNFDALRADHVHTGRTLVAARVGNYATIASALPAESERLLVEQLAKRLTVGASKQTLYQGDEGIFAWFAEQESLTSVGEHLEALAGFFRNSIDVAGEPIDLTISFGVDADARRSLPNRIGSALLAAEEAAAEGLKWKVHDPAMLEGASWKLSLLGQLDRAIDSGDLWVAYQPKLDLATRTICGAEALVRWTHPEKGAIQPLDFILAAEQSDRIDRLTRFVLERAIASAARMVGDVPNFDIAVNLSTRLIDNASFSAYVLGLLARHQLPPGNLTLEVTETAAISGGGANMETLVALRKAGVQVSIDDYGTGLSTLEYLRKIPATEIKIDQSFVQGITKNPADRLMVHSTIELVHSLGHRVVAEGVEDAETLEALAAMNCDQAQGFLISRPVPFREFLRLIAKQGSERAINTR